MKLDPAPIEALAPDTILNQSETAKLCGLDRVLFFQRVSRYPIPAPFRKIGSSCGKIAKAGDIAHWIRQVNDFYSTVPSGNSKGLHGKTILSFILTDGAKMPTFGSEEAAAFDIAAIETLVVPPHTTTAIRTGLIPVIPKKHAILIYSRSGHGFKHGIRLGNCVGVIDADYTGEIKIALHNDSDYSFTVTAGDRIAQGILQKIDRPVLMQAYNARITARGQNGFGSTGL